MVGCILHKSFINPPLQKVPGFCLEYARTPILTQGVHSAANVDVNSDFFSIFFSGRPQAVSKNFSGDAPKTLNLPLIRLQGRWHAPDCSRKNFFTKYEFFR